MISREVTGKHDSGGGGPSLNTGGRCLAGTLTKFNGDESFGWESLFGLWQQYATIVFSWFSDDKTSRLVYKKDQKPPFPSSGHRKWQNLGGQVPLHPFPRHVYSYIIPGDLPAYLLYTYLCILVHTCVYFTLHIVKRRHQGRFWASTSCAIAAHSPPCL